MPLTLECLDALQGEPDWLGERRRGALATYERLPNPSKTDEEWRRTDISGLNTGQFSELEHKNGSTLEVSSLPRGVILEPLRVAAEKHAQLVEPLLFSLIKTDRDRFTALHAAASAADWLNTWFASSRLLRPTACDMRVVVPTPSVCVAAKTTIPCAKPTQNTKLAW